MSSPHSPSQNHLLAALPAAEFERLAEHLELIPMPYEVLALDCKGEFDCPKVVRRSPGMLTVVGMAVTEPVEMSALGASSGEGAVDICEQLLRSAYAALEREIG